MRVTTCGDEGGVQVVYEGSKTVAKTCDDWGGFWWSIEMTNPPGTYDEPTNNWRSIGLGQ